MSEQDQGGGHNRPTAGFTYGNTPQDVSELADAGKTLARVCYNQPGVVLLSVASETHFDPRPIVEAVRAVDPDRILIPISGNMKDWGTAYDQPPGYSLPQECWNNVVDDFHCYYGWYNQKGEIWKFWQRRLAAARLVTVGEFGTEALDAYSTMIEHYPPHFPATPPQTADGAPGPGAGGEGRSATDHRVPRPTAGELGPIHRGQPELPGRRAGRGSHAIPPLATLHRRLFPVPFHRRLARSLAEIDREP